MAHRSTGRHLVACLVVAALSVAPLWGQSKPAAPKPADLDKLLAPIALYPDQLLAQMLLCASTPGDVTALNGWLSTTTTLKGTELQDAAQKAGFQPSFVALALFPQTVKMMADQMAWTKQLGQAFANHRADVFASIQRLRTQAKQAGNLKTNSQQEVETRTTSSGQEVIVIEPANPQVVYVPQYNSTVVYTTPATTSTTVVVQDNNSSADAAAAAVVGFGVGIAIGAAIDNDYYYGPYGWHGGAYMYNDAWDDYYDHREDAREDWMDNREDLAEERTERQGNRQEQRTERAGNRDGTAAANAQTAAQNRTSTQSRSASQESRGYSGTRSQSATERSGTSSSAFSGYSSGKSERAASSRGQSSRGARRSGGGGGGGRRR
jgi:hypothetical protein